MRERWEEDKPSRNRPPNVQADLEGIASKLDVYRRYKYQQRQFEQENDRDEEGQTIIDERGD
jgi:hypothetical protein